MAYVSMIIAGGLGLMLLGVMIITTGPGQSFQNTLFYLGSALVIIGVIRCVYLLGVRARRRIQR